MKKALIFNPVYLLGVGLIFLISLFSACQKVKMNEDDLKCPVTAKEGADDNVIGKWKLVKTRVIKLAYGISTEDYSCNNIIYHFKEDGLLIVSGEYEGVHGFGNGEHIYEFEDTPSYGIDGTYTIKFGNTSMGCSIQENKMILDLAPLDGNTYYFVRVE